MESLLKLATAVDWDGDIISEAVSRLGLHALVGSTLDCSTMLNSLQNLARCT